MSNTGANKPSRKERMRPAELIGMAAVIAVFSGLITLMVTREIVTTAIIAGVIFILALVTIALLVLMVKPDDAELKDLDEQDQQGGSNHH